jgi:hypothetical protein
MTGLAIPMQVIDKFLLQWNVGQALLLLFLLSVPGAILTGSRKALSLNVIAFGVIFLVTPASLTAEFHYRVLGLVLLVFGPVLYVTARK